MPDTPSGLFGKLASAQATMSVARDKTVKVEMRNGGSYTYDYITEDAITSAIRTHLATLGVATLPSFPECDDLGVVGDEHVVRVRAEVTFADNDTGATFTCSGWGYGTDKGDKAIGKAQTSAIRVLLCKVLLQAGGDDGEATNTTGSRSAPSRTSFSVSEAQLKRLWAIAKNNGWEASGVEADAVVRLATRIFTRKEKPPIGVESLNQIPSKQVYEEVAAFLEGATPEKLDAVAAMQRKVDESAEGVPVADAVKAFVSSPVPSARPDDDDVPF